jgi:hypothetical protein
MLGGPAVLFHSTEGCFVNCLPYFADLLSALEEGWPAFGKPEYINDFTAIGEYIIDCPKLPWLYGDVGGWNDSPELIDESAFFRGRPGPLSQIAYLGAAAMLLILEEVSPHRENPRRKLGPLRGIAPYLTHRQGLGQRTKLPSLLVPDEFKQTFRDWAEGRVSFTERD